MYTYITVQHNISNQSHIHIFECTKHCFWVIHLLPSYVLRLFIVCTELESKTAVSLIAYLPTHPLTTPPSHTHLEEESVLLDARYVEVIAVSTHTNHQKVIGHLVHPAGVQTAGALHYLPLHVQATGVGEMEMMLVSEAGVSDGLDDAAELQRAHGGAGQQGSEEEVVPGADHDHVKQHLIGLPEDAVAAPPRAQDHQPPPLAFSFRAACGEVLAVVAAI